tara:strand:- start:110 stop:697 length:588 start_codon:yes stop_codon:yes gene_type:complete
MPPKKKLKKKKKNQINFEDYPNFKPNITPKEILQAGSFGGTYFRDIYSSVTKKKYKGKKVIEEFPKDWFEGLDIDKYIISSDYDKSINKYKVKCGSSLEDWEKKNWITEHDPYGWFQWYCRFYMGRRIKEEDDRQISRWLGLGRFKNRLYGMIERKKGIESLNDITISPVIRQVLHHWAYKVNRKDYLNYISNKK